MKLLKFFSFQNRITKNATKIDKATGIKASAPEKGKPQSYKTDRFPYTMQTPSDLSIVKFRMFQSAEHCDFLHLSMETVPESPIATGQEISYPQ